MWPFKKEKSPESQPSEYKEEIRRKNEWLDRRLAALSEWRSPGETFVYLGVTMVVTRTSRIEEEVIWTGYGSLKYFKRGPFIDARYLDNNGVIQNVVFDFEEAEAIMAANCRRRAEQVTGN